MELEELENKIKIANEIIKAINISIDSEKIYHTLNTLKGDLELRINLEEEIELIRRDLEEEKYDTIKRVLKAILGDEYIDPVNADYEKIGFKGWEYDECPHYAITRVYDKHAIIYMCRDELTYSLPPA